MARLTGSSYVKIALIILLCVIICGTLTGGLWFVHSAINAWNDKWTDRYSTWVADSEFSTGSFSVEAASVQSIEINWLAGRVDLSVVDDAQTGGMVQVTETEDTRMPLRWYNNGGQLQIDYGDVRGFASWWPFNRSKDLVVLVPLSIADDLTAFTLSAASGEYTLSGLGCKTLEIDQASGNIKINDFSADNATFEIASGRTVYNGKVAGDLTVEMASGDAQISLGTYNPVSADLSLASGNLTLMLPVPDFRVQLSKMSGAFNSDFELYSKGDTYYCAPEDNGGLAGSSEGGRSASDGYMSSAQTKIDMDMMSGNFYIGRS